MTDEPPRVQLVRGRPTPAELAAITAVTRAAFLQEQDEATVPLDEPATRWRRSECMRSARASYRGWGAS